MYVNNVCKNPQSRQKTTKLNFFFQINTKKYLLISNTNYNWSTYFPCFSPIITFLYSFFNYLPNMIITRNLPISNYLNNYLPTSLLVETNFHPSDIYKQRLKKVRLYWCCCYFFFLSTKLIIIGQFFFRIIHLFAIVSRKNTKTTTKYVIFPSQYT